MPQVANLVKYPEPFSGSPWMLDGSLSLAMDAALSLNELLKILADFEYTAALGRRG